MATPLNQAPEYQFSPTSQTWLAIFWRRFRRHRLAMAGAVIILLLIGAAVLAPYITQYDRDKINLLQRTKPPSAEHWFGTDVYGRDVFTRVVYGTRVSLQVGFTSMSISVFVGVIIGAISGYYGGLVDNLLMRLTDVFLSIPVFFLILTVIALFKPTPFSIMAVIGLTSWPALARLVRGEFLSLRERDFTEAARATGASDLRIIFRHIMPNAMAPVIVSGTLRVAYAILIEAALSYLGLGIQPPTPSWGNMLLEGQPQILRGVWWLAFFPGAAIFLTVMAFNAVGDGLRDALDPRLKQ